jgi:hypothetical protein
VSLVTVLPEKHRLASGPVVRLFEEKKEHLVMLSTQIDPESVVVEAGSIDLSSTYT